MSLLRQLIAGECSGDAFEVTLTSADSRFLTGTVDKTPTQIKQAARAGRRIVCRLKMADTVIYTAQPVSVGCFMAGTLQLLAVMDGSLAVIDTAAGVSGGTFTTTFYQLTPAS